MINFGSSAIHNLCHDLDQYEDSRFRKFADDAKMLEKVNSLEEKHRAKEDLNQLEQWGKKWQMEFNTSKCQVMHFGKKK